MAAARVLNALQRLEKGRVAIAALSLGCYALALLLPFIEKAVFGLPDQFVLLELFFSPLVAPRADWFAHPLFWGGMVCFVQARDNLAAGCSLGALFLGTYTAAFPIAVEGIVSYSGSAAYWTWMASAGILALGALFAKEITGNGHTNWWRLTLLALPVLLYVSFLVSPTTVTTYPRRSLGYWPGPPEVRSGAREVIHAVEMVAPLPHRPLGALAHVCFWAAIWALVRRYSFATCILASFSLAGWLWYTRWLLRTNESYSTHVLAGYYICIAAMGGLTLVGWLFASLGARPGAARAFRAAPPTDPWRGGWH